MKGNFFEGWNVAAVSNINALQSAVVFAERKVQRDRDQVAQDEGRLDQSRSLLQQDAQSLARAQRESQRAQAANTPLPTTPRLDRAIDIQVPANVLPKQPTRNTLGQTVGQLIDVEA